MIKVIGPASVDPTGLTTVGLEKGDGKQEKTCFRSIRCGLSLPISEYPGYYCILGLLNGGNPGEPGSLLLLGEGEQDLLRGLMEAVLHKAEVLRFSEIFTDLQSPEWIGMVAEAQKLIRQDNNRQKPRFQHVRWADDFHLARDLIREWGKKGALVIPEDSILYTQMVNSRPQGVPEGTKHEFYRINAIRYVARAFDKIAARPPRGSTPDVPSSART